MADAQIQPSSAGISRFADPGHRPHTRGALSFHGGRPASTCSSSSSSTRGPWHATALPLDIPGAGPGRSRRGRPYLVSQSAPANTDAVLSRSLLEQCRLEDSRGGASDSPGLRRRGRWAGKDVVERLGTKTLGTKASLLSTWEPVRWSGPRDGGGMGRGVSSVGQGEVEFAKIKPTMEQPQRRVSALSAALRGCYLGPEKASGPDVIDRPQQHRLAEGKRYDQVEIVTTPENDHSSREVESLQPLHRNGHGRNTTPIQADVRSRARTDSMATSYTSSVSSGTNDCPYLTDTESPGVVSHIGQRRALLDRLMEHAFVSLAKNEGKGDGESTTPWTPASAASTAQSTSGPNAQSSGKRRPVHHRSDDDDEEEQRRPVPKRSKHQQTGARMLACPYFKRNPRRYQRERSCVGPGWETMHRLKEHLYRCHTLPIHCLRCHAVFPGEDALRAHSLSDTPCQRRPAGASADDLMEGIGLAQERRLRSRKRTTKTEEDKWRDAYRVCFPDDTCTPSPYYEIPSPSESAASGSSDLLQYEDFVQAELPRRVRAELNEWLDRELVPIEARLRPRLADWVRDIQLSLLEEFRSRGPGANAGSPRANLASPSTGPPSTARAGAAATEAHDAAHGGASNRTRLGSASAHDSTAQQYATIAFLPAVSALCTPDSTNRLLLESSETGYAPLATEMAFSAPWNMAQPDAFFFQDNEPADCAWTGLAGDLVGCVPGVDDWDSAWGE